MISTRRTVRDAAPILMSPATDRRSTSVSVRWVNDSEARGRGKCSSSSHVFWSISISRRAVTLAVSLVAIARESTSSSSPSR